MDIPETEWGGQFRWSFTDPQCQQLLRRWQGELRGLGAVYDNDGLWTWGEPREEGPRTFARMVDQYVDAGAVAIRFGTGNCLAWNFRPHLMEPAWEKEGATGPIWGLMPQYVAAGTDPLTVLLDAAHSRALPVLANFRFNRYHPHMSPPMVDAWFTAHPEYHLSRASCPWLHVAQNPWKEQFSIDLAHPEVRERMVRDLVDVVEHYPVDGLALELQRAAPFFELDEPDKAGHLNDFVRGLRRELDRIGSARGKRLELSLWLPTEGHHRVLRSQWPERFFGEEVWGLDPAAWIAEGLVDSLMLSLYAQDLGMAAPAALPAWVDQARGTRTQVYGCAMNLSPRHGPESCARAAAVVRQLAEQLDGVFLFNTQPYHLAAVFEAAAGRGGEA